MGGVVPLSEHEQRQLEQIEQALYREDPRFGRLVRSSDPRVHYKRKLAQALIGMVVGAWTESPFEWHGETWDIPPRDVQEAMNRQLSAERTRRAVAETGHETAFAERPLRRRGVHAGGPVGGHRQGADPRGGRGRSRHLGALRDPVR